jgi:hypothetical protein
MGSCAISISIASSEWLSVAPWRVAAFRERRKNAAACPDQVGLLSPPGGLAAVVWGSFPVIGLFSDLFETS